MKLDSLIIAEGVATTPDGNFFIHGGGFSRYEVPELPFPIPLSVLIRFAVDDREIQGVEHYFRVSFIGPTGNPNVPPIDFSTDPNAQLPPLMPGEQRYLQAAIRLGAVIVRPGLYRLQLDVDGERVRTLPVPITVAEGPLGQPRDREWPNAQ